MIRVDREGSARAARPRGAAQRYAPATVRGGAVVCSAPPAGAPLRRSARGAHITCEREDELIGHGGLGLVDGDVIALEHGAPLHEGEVVVRCSW